MPDRGRTTSGTAHGVTAKPATITDVAELAGVAKSSVSNYLNGTVRVADATAARIAMAITKLDYRPAAAARTLTSRRRTAFDAGRLPPGRPCLTVAGQMSVDTIAEVAALPGADARVPARAVRKAIGGPGARVAMAAAATGPVAPVAVSLVTSVGDDLDGDWAVAELARRQVAVLGPPDRRDGHTAQAVILRDDLGARSVVAGPVGPVATELDRFLGRTQPDADRRWGLHFDGPQATALPDRAAAARAAGFRVTMHGAGLEPAELAHHLDALLATFELVFLDRGSFPPGGIDALIADMQARRVRGGPSSAEVVICDGTGEIVALEASGHARRAALPPGCVTNESCDASVGTYLAAWLNGLPGWRALALAARAAQPSRAADVGDGHSPAGPRVAAAGVPADHRRP